MFTEELKKHFSKNTVSGRCLLQNVYYLHTVGCTFNRCTICILGHFSKIITTSEMHETKMGSVTIQAVTGDITKETTDVIVNSSNENFTLKRGYIKIITL